MTEIRYATAADQKWIAVVVERRVLVVERSVGGVRADELWSSLRDAPGIQAVLDGLTRGGISQTPTFALVEIPANFDAASGSIRLIARGPIRLAVQTAGQTDSISGDGVSTWIERSVAGAASIEIGRDEVGARSSGDGELFRLADGIAPVSLVQIALQALDSGAPAVNVPNQSTSSAPPTKLVAAAEPPPEPLPALVEDPGMTITDAPAPDDQTAAGSNGGYDFLFGETVVRTVEDAAVRVEDSSASARGGDHDGKTAIGLTAAERRAARKPRQRVTDVRPPESPQFNLDFSTGTVEPLDAAIIVGRAPSASKVSMDSVPRLVTVGGPDQDISRSHVRVSLEGGTVMVTDLHSRNGTVVTLPDRPPQQLRGGQPTAVISGAVIDLGSGVTITVREH